MLSGGGASNGRLEAFIHISAREHLVEEINKTAVLNVSVNGIIISSGFIRLLAPTFLKPQPCRQEDSQQLYFHVCRLNLLLRTLFFPHFPSEIRRWRRSSSHGLMFTMWQLVWRYKCDLGLKRRVFFSV